MATLLHSESRRLYSWWWDSHNTPKNSKWLQENLTDMDGKVKTMIKLIEEDADSFARRAEMYYKKRPELMKLVEEFYRAYRALAERYNHATGELRHAHRTIAAAFPDQVPLELVEDDLVVENAHGLSVKSSGPHNEDSERGIRAMGLKQLQELFGAKEVGSPTSKATRNVNLNEKILDESDGAGKAESEIEGLKKALSDMQAEKEDVFLKYQECLEKLHKLEGELSNAEKDSMRLNERASRAEIEVQTLREALVQLEAEKNAGLIKHEEYLERIYCLEAMASQFQKDMEGLDDRAIQAESLYQTLKDEMLRLELEKETVLHQHKQCLGKIMDLENDISANEDEARRLREQAERAETEVSELKKAHFDMKMEKEASAFQYKCCMETISNLEKDLLNAKKDVERLNNEVSIGTAKLKNADEKSNLLEISNQSLRAEANNLSEKIATKDQELLKKQEELEKLETCLQDEHLRYQQVEATLKTLQDLHSQSQDYQRALAHELNSMLKLLKEMEESKNGLEGEIQRVKDENHGLSQMNLSSAVSMENMQNEIISLTDIRERLEKEVLHHTGISVSLQQEISCLKEEIDGLNRSYQALSKSLQDDNSKLREKCEESSNDKTILLKKIEDMEEVLKKNEFVQSSLSDLNVKLASSRENMKALQESCQFLQGEKAALVAEKASLLSQLQAMTENMHNLLERNAVLENSLSNAKVELEGLREKSKGLEEICELLKNEKSYLLSERDVLVFKLENVERRLECLEKKFMGLEEKYADLEKEKEAMHFQVEKLELSLGVEKQEQTSSQLISETRLAALENHIHFLQEENKWKKKESEEELEKALKAQFEISILQKFLKDMEEKNYTLIAECQKHVEASKLAEKLISELESESLEQQVEAELLLDEIERLRLGIYQIFGALESGLDCGPDNKVENERTFIDHILESVDKMKHSISKHEDEKQQLLVENLVLVALLEQLESKGVEIESQRIHLELENKNIAEKVAIIKNEKNELLEINRQLKSDLNRGHEDVAALEGELRSLWVKNADLQKAYNALREAYSQLNQENTYLLKKNSDLKEENDAVFLEFLATANQSVFLRSLGAEKITEMKLLLEDLDKQCEVNCGLEKETSTLRGELELQKAENVALKDAVCSLEREVQEIKESNVEMKWDLINGKESLIQTEAKLEAAENLTSTLSSTVAELKINVDELLQIRKDLENKILHLSENNSTQKNEIKGLREINKNLESEIGLLQQEMEENVAREQNLSMELQEMNNESELWENEASTFCFDLQVSSIHEVLLKNKVKELTGTCRALENERAAKTLEIEEMKENFSLMENEITGLKSKLDACGSITASLRDDITVLERNAPLHTKVKAAHNQEPEFFGDDVRDTSQILVEDECLLSLQNLQMRVKAVGKLMEEMNKKPVSHRRSNSNGKEEPTTGETDRVKPRRSSGRDKHDHTRRKGSANEPDDSPKLHKIKTKTSEARNGMLMKDIPLDQVSNGSLRETRTRGGGVVGVGSDDEMLELWETAEDVQTIVEPLRTSYRMKKKDIAYDHFGNSTKGNTDPPSTDSDMEKELEVDRLELSTKITEPMPEINASKILDRLSSDANKLETLQTTVQILRKKVETNNKKGRKAKNIDFEMVNEQLLEADDNIVHLVDLNEQLVKNIEYCPDDETASPRMKDTVRIWIMKVMDEARKGSDRIDRLQVELQRIQYVVSKMEDEKKNKGKNKLLRSRSVILRDFIYDGRKNSGKRKKPPRCGCFRQSTNKSGNSL